MELPLQITYRGISPSNRLSRLIANEETKLEHFFGRIVSCRVIVAREHHIRDAAPIRVRVEVGVPGNELLTDAMQRDPEVAIRSAFKRARRRVSDYARRLIGLH